MLAGLFSCDPGRNRGRRQKRHGPWTSPVWAASQPGTGASPLRAFPVWKSGGAGGRAARLRSVGGGRPFPGRDLREEERSDGAWRTASPTCPPKSARAAVARFPGGASGRWCGRRSHGAPTAAGAIAGARRGRRPADATPLRRLPPSLRAWKAHHRSFLRVTCRARARRALPGWHRHIRQMRLVQRQEPRSILLRDQYPDTTFRFFRAPRLLWRRRPVFSGGGMWGRTTPSPEGDAS